MNSHVMIPSGGRIFLSQQPDVFQHGADVRRGASFAIQVMVDATNATAITYTSKQGNPRTILIETLVPLPTKVLELVVREKTEEGFRITVERGEQAIRERLQR